MNAFSVGLQRHALPMPLVDDRRHAELPAAGQLAMHEVHGPVLATGGGDRGRDSVQADPLPATDSHTNLEPLQLVQPMDPVATDPPALARQQDMQPFVSESRPGRRQFAQPLSQDAAVAGLGAVIPGGVPQAAQRAGAAYAQLKAIAYPSCDVPASGRG